MLNSPNESSLVTLRVDAGEQPVEIFVINHRFERVAKGTRLLEIELEPGIYKVRLKAASILQEQLVSLETGSAPVEIVVPQLEFSSPVPLQGTRTTHSQHQKQAEEHSRQIHSTYGQGSELFVFVRDFAETQDAGAPDPAVGEVAAGLSLHDVTGKKLVDFAKTGARAVASGETPGWAACNVALAPGVYRLRLKTRAAGVLEQIVVTAQNWQTQVFLTRRAYGRGEGFRANLAEAATLMAHRGAGFGANRDDARQAELARQGLADARAVISPADLRDILNGKFQNPMLGIYGAHLLLLQDKPDLALLQIVVSNLKRLIGVHPDVQALELLLTPNARHRKTLVFPTPPMLRSSWKTVLQNSAAHPGLVPAGSLAARVAAQLWGNGAWLVYALKAPVSASAGETNSLTPQNLRRLIAQLTEKMAPDSVASRAQCLKLVEDMARKNGLSDLECDLLRYLASSMALPGFPKQTATPKKHIAKPKTALSAVAPNTSQPLTMMVSDFSADTVQKTTFVTALAVRKPKTARPSRKSAAQQATSQRENQLKSRLNRKNLVENLGVPVATLEEATASLREKLRFKP